MFCLLLLFGEFPTKQGKPSSYQGHWATGPVFATFAKFVLCSPSLHYSRQAMFRLMFLICLRVVPLVNYLGWLPWFCCFLVSYCTGQRIFSEHRRLLPRPDSVDCFLRSGSLTSRRKCLIEKKAPHFFPRPPTVWTFVVRHDFYATCSPLDGQSPVFIGLHLSQLSSGFCPSTV